MAPPDLPDIRIPEGLLPGDGRFGCGPSKVRLDALAALASTGSSYLGTSHRQPGVRAVVAAIKRGLEQLFALPQDYRVVLGVGGATAFWDCAAFGLVERRSQHLAFGEFGAKFADAVRLAPHVEDPDVITSPAGTHPAFAPGPDLDLYAHPHNETSTGVVMPVRRPGGTDEGALLCVDATSAAGGLRVDPLQFDIYYFAPQKCFASDGGLWLALCSPAALERIDRIKASGRRIPPSLDLATAVENSAKDQTYNTPALATLFLMREQLDWMLSNSGLEGAALRCERSAQQLYAWAEASSYAEPFVAEPAERSAVVGTIDLDAALSADVVSGVLRANGIVDTESYRKLGRNQLRIGMFPTIEPDDVGALTRCIDHVAEALT